MKSKKKAIGISLIMLVVAVTRADAQTSEISNLFRNLEARPVGGKPGTVDEAEPVLERLTLASRESVAGDLPAILHAANDPHVSVRRVAASALYEITTRSDGPGLLSTETATFDALLTDIDIPIRRITIMSIGTLRPNANSPLVPVLEAFLPREDAVSTIGPAVAPVLMEAAPTKLDATNAVAQYMRRKDQTSETRDSLLNSIQLVKGSHHEIGAELAKEVMAYADDPNEQTSVHAIGTLQSLGKDAILDSQQSLSRIAADTTRAPSVRTAATKALSVVQ
ncbi:MAG: HEAT repeat domain-containing protein [Acidobacteriota bacterium]|nr:HEAT repeat domain-containing protein [Acidobacteriota bacterium]